ncbi:MAG: DUF2627 domain-containing protein [Alicyclobacillus sp.]|nr:DUF2627 domain-containing protein [Alicyclobacillus sp.]
MRNAVAWSIVIGVFLLAGEGLNLVRIHLVDWLAYGRAVDAWLSVAGLLLAFLCTAFLGGFVYYRDQKRGKLKREGWRGRPVKRIPPRAAGPRREPGRSGPCDPRAADESR